MSSYCPIPSLLGEPPFNHLTACIISHKFSLMLPKYISHLLQLSHPAQFYCNISLIHNRSHQAQFQCVASPMHTRHSQKLNCNMLTAAVESGSVRATMCVSGLAEICVYMQTSDTLYNLQSARLTISQRFHVSYLHILFFLSIIEH